MKVTQIQMNIKWGDIAENCSVASRLIDSQPGSDLYVLPEMFSTGFAVEPEGIADDSLTTLHWMQKKANEINAAICGSVATKVTNETPCYDNDAPCYDNDAPCYDNDAPCYDNDAPCYDNEKTLYYNRFYFVKPQLEQDYLQSSPLGEVEGAVYYDKHHLFTYGKENINYEAGKDKVIVEWRGVKFLLQVCYDLRFPCFSRNTLTNGNALYDCVIYVASWPTSRMAVWHTLLKARALENQCYILGVNRIGTDPACSYCGGTECIDAYGRVIASCPDNEQGTITTDIDMDKLQAFRKKFPVLMDADTSLP